LPGSVCPTKNGRGNVRWGERTWGNVREEYPRFARMDPSLHSDSHLHAPRFHSPHYDVIAEQRYTQGGRLLRGEHTHVHFIWIDHYE
jgi:hypothetical protein